MGIASPVCFAGRRLVLVVDELGGDVRMGVLPRAKEERQLQLAAVRERAENAHGDLVLRLLVTT